MAGRLEQASIRGLGNRALDEGKVDQIMKKFHLIWLALVATVAFGAISAASASAEVALWLINGGDITALTTTTTTGSLNLINKTILGNITVLCEGIFDGSVGAEGEDEITKLLSLAGVEIPETLTAGTGLSCIVDAGSSLCATNELAEVWPMNLPWHTQLLLEGEGYKDELGTGSVNGKEPGYHVFCTISKAENLCEGIISSVIKNGTSGVEGEFVHQPSRTCSVGTGEVDSGGVPGIISLTSGTLTVSMP